MSLGQGVVMILAGAIADHYSPAWVIAVAGTAGAVTAAAIAVSWARDRGRVSNGHLQCLGVSPSGCRAWRTPCLQSGGTDSGHGVSPSGCRAWRTPCLRLDRIGAGKRVSPSGCHARHAPLCE
jgi:hypothetical protein